MVIEIETNMNLLEWLSMCIILNLNDQVYHLILNGNHTFGHFSTLPQKESRNGGAKIREGGYLIIGPVSYTHLTLPTNREV